jgi:hypothetical protein
MGRWRALDGTLDGMAAVHEPGYFFNPVNPLPQLAKLGRLVGLCNVGVRVAVREKVVNDHADDGK